MTDSHRACRAISDCYIPDLTTISRSQPNCGETRLQRGTIAVDFFSPQSQTHFQTYSHIPADLHELPHRTSPSVGLGLLHYSLPVAAVHLLTNLRTPFERRQGECVVLALRCIGVCGLPQPGRSGRGCELDPGLGNGTRMSIGFCSIGVVKAVGPTRIGSA